MTKQQYRAINCNTYTIMKMKSLKYSFLFFRSDNATNLTLHL